MALPTDMSAFFRIGEPALAAARAALSYIARRPALPVGERATYLFDEVKLTAPVSRPGKILCGALNYHARRQERLTTGIEAVCFMWRHGVIEILSLPPMLVWIINLGVPIAPLSRSAFASRWIGSRR